MVKECKSSSLKQDYCCLLQQVDAEISADEGQTGCWLVGDGITVENFLVFLSKTKGVKNGKTAV